MITIAKARTDDLETIRKLFREYADEFTETECFEGYEEELAGLPGRYAEPDGRILLATRDGDAAGCVVMYRADGVTAEMKRLWVRPNHRNQKIGRRLVETLLAEAKSAGYKKMVLDTTPSMAVAIPLYRKVGFRETGRVGGANGSIIRMERDL